MAIDIASPGANEDDLRDALAGRMGLRLLDSGTIASPVAYLDLALPAGYVVFYLEMCSLSISAVNDDFLAAAFSADGGVTFLSDYHNFDTYMVQLFEQSSAGGGVAVPVALTDALLRLTDTLGSDVLGALSLRIMPGSATELASLRGEMNCRGGDPNAVNTFALEFSSLDPLATVTPTNQRVNLIRFVPYGNADINPPTSGETITAGSYFLWGVPTP